MYTRSWESSYNKQLNWSEHANRCDNKGNPQMGCLKKSEMLPAPNQEDNTQPVA